jgi:hypothetical protein
LADLANNRTAEQLADTPRNKAIVGPLIRAAVLLKGEGIVTQLLAIWTFVNDFGQWLAIGGLAILAYRAEMRARTGKRARR